MDSSTPVEVSSITTASRVEVGFEHVCALLSGGTVKCWGWNGFGDLGSGTWIRQSTTPVQVAGLTGVTQLSAGGLHNCVLVAGGKAKCWGNDYDGQLGDGHLGYSSSAVEVVGVP